MVASRHNTGGDTATQKGAAMVGSGYPGGHARLIQLLNKCFSKN